MGLHGLRRVSALLIEWRIHTKILQRSIRILVLIAIAKIKIPRINLGIRYFLERAMGLEPTTAAMARRYSSQLSYARVRAPLYIFLIKSKEKCSYFSFCLCFIFVYTTAICLVANPLHITRHCSHMN